MKAPVLSVTNLSVRYEGVHAVQGISFDVPAGGVLALLGRNGAGKSTTLKALMGIEPTAAGCAMFEGTAITGLKSHIIARRGLAYVPETRGIFPSLSTIENLTVAARLPDDAWSSSPAWTLERVFALFPRLAERRDTRAGQLSGGEQQMLSIARALLTNPRLLLLDEPTEGLAPVIVDQLERAILQLKMAGLSVLLVEQNLAVALACADQVAVMGKGLLHWHGTPAQFEDAGTVRDAWLTV